MSEYKFANVEKSIKRKQAEAILPEEPVHQGKWRNLNFRKDGTSEWGDLTHDTEEAAIKAANHTDDDRKRYRGLKYKGGSIPWADYSHTLQMPIREGGE